MTKNYSDADHVKHSNRIMEGKLQDIVKIGRENVNNNRVVDGVADCDLTEYSSHVLSNIQNQENVNRSWLQDLGMVIKFEQPKKMKLEGN